MNKYKEQALELIIEIHAKKVRKKQSKTLAIFTADKMGTVAKYQWSINPKEPNYHEKEYWSKVVKEIKSIQLKDI